MNFTVSSSELLKGLLSVQKVISSKTTLPILENFLFVLKGSTLQVTASDAETTLRTSIETDSVSEEGEAAVPAKLLTDYLREFPDQPLKFVTKNDTSIEISWATGTSQIPYFPASDYPEIQQDLSSASVFTIPSETLLNGINYTAYATAEEEFRPAMNGILFDLSAESITLVASDAHKLVCFTSREASGQETSSFILHKKPAAVLKSILSKNDGAVKVSFDAKNVSFEFGGTFLICRLVEGKFPPYRSVIPANNPNILVIDRLPLLNALKRVTVCSNQATSLVRLMLTGNTLELSAQDPGFSISAYEKMMCQYDGYDLEIGFKGPFLIDILSNLPYDEVMIKFADAAKAALILPADPDGDDADICALLMPVKVN